MLKLLCGRAKPAIGLIKLEDFVSKVSHFPLANKWGNWCSGTLSPCIALKPHWAKPETWLPTSSYGVSQPLASMALSPPSIWLQYIIYIYIVKTNIYIWKTKEAIKLPWLRARLTISAWSCNWRSSKGTGRKEAIHILF